MSCELDRTKLAAYLDGELADAEAVEVARHLSGCTTCAAEIAESLRVRRGLAAARTRFVPSAEFRRRLGRQAVVRKRSWGMIWVAAPVLAAVLVVAVLWVVFPQGAAVSREVADLHVTALASSNPLDVVSTDRHTVKPWFQGRIPFSFNVPEMAGSEFTLLGGRMVYLQQQPGAQLIVAMKQHRISVLIFQDASPWQRFPGGGGVQHRDTFSEESWTAGGLRFFVIGDIEPGEIDRLAALMKTANR